MKKAFFLVGLLTISKIIFAQTEIGPDGDKLLGIIIGIALLGVVFLVLRKTGGKKTQKTKKPFFQFKRVQIELKKDRVYFPDFLNLSVKNTGNTDIDLDRPLLIFDNFWLKRKFKIKGMENRTFYPLYLEKGKTHTLEIDINRFYRHDKKLKKFPKAKIIISDVKGRRLGSKSVFLKKTLFKF
ncbi:hypothetical protein GM418_10205 [Maribellus comscasis]|uniref:Uncharacterized protein n=1 Tax=Maribellus comscasis TaxID=2681766 RepID=A0A6I6JMB4_9BACT|nr:hypothetical protein [Maribellus comscasis]QGY44015.1 hypothetical protein GM418_10205 [Maribellus comscasis]